jgi:hypothetical protein
LLVYDDDLVGIALLVVAKDVDAVVRRAIVDTNDFDIIERLVDKRVQAPRKVLLYLVAGHDDAYAYWGGGVLDHVSSSLATVIGVRL